MKLVSLSKRGLVLEPRYYFFGWSRSPQVVGSARLVKALAQARSYLPRGYTFKVWDCQRPRAVQLAMIASFRRRLKLQYPKASAARVEQMVYRFAAKPLLRVTRLDTHRHGGAVDLTIVDRRGHELYMGTDHDDLTERAATSYYETKVRFTAPEAEARRNRRLLAKVMRRAGFENFAPEWWHWSIC